jgi:polyisoprenoid-binding protein YceI
MIDFQDLQKSKVDVTLDMSRATGSIGFVTDAMVSPSVLATAQFPTAQFISTAVNGSTRGAALSGNLTLRGTTAPVSLDVIIYRVHGSDPGDLSRLTLLITGTISRTAFGATGYADLVSDPVRLRILANVSRR